ncbi:MAG: hydroxymethylbilane synthase, partial [Candidatus Binataceae bacterium]
MAQGAIVKAQLEAVLPGLAAEVVPISTSGDRMATAALAQIGGKGLFIRELEQALSAGTIDLAVHSMKDLPAILAPPYRIAAVPPRENPRDALLTRDGTGWDAL